MYTCNVGVLMDHHVVVGIDDGRIEGDVELAAGLDIRIDEDFQRCAAGGLVDDAVGQFDTPGLRDAIAAALERQSARDQ